MTRITFIALVFLLACQTKQDTIEKQYIDPASGYTQAVTVSANGVKTIYLSGQIGEGEDLEAQMRGALANIERLLNESGASFDDVVKMNHYIVDYQPEDLEVFRNTRKEIMGDKNMPASTLVGVTSLFAEGYLIEIDAVAVINE